MGRLGVGKLGLFKVMKESMLDCYLELWMSFGGAWKVKKEKAMFVDSLPITLDLPS